MISVHTLGRLAAVPNVLSKKDSVEPSVTLIRRKYLARRPISFAAGLALLTELDGEVYSLRNGKFNLTLLFFLLSWQV